MTCNGTDTHTAFVGDNITYACSFDYQGLWFFNKGKWTGPGVILDQRQEAATWYAVATAEQYECETGEPPSGVLKLT